MYARLTTAVASAERDAAAGRDAPDVLEQVMPILRKLDGFKGIIVFSEDGGDRVVSLSLWETAEALEANSPILDRIRDVESSRRGVESLESLSFRVIGFDVRWLVTEALER